MKMCSQTGKKSLCGFTLTESAIVLGILALVLGAVWVAANAVYRNQQITRAHEELLTIVGNTRAIYTGKGYFDVAADITPGLVRAEALPADMVRSDNLPYSPWGERVWIWANGSYQFRVVFGISARNAVFCPALLRRFVGGAMDAGVVGVRGPNGYLPVSPTNLPTIGTLTGLCRTGAATDIAIYFALKA